jgi:CheY-like chemotaxis protein
MTTTEPKTILVVEDEPFVRMMAVDMLEDAGYAVREAGTADEALSLLETDAKIDIVFTDIKMPGSMDGLALAEIVGSRWPDIGIIITSGHISLPEQVGPTQAVFLPKPYRSHMLSAEVARLAA